MDDRLIIPMHSRRLAQQVLAKLDAQGLHDPTINVIPVIVKTADGYGIQVSRFDRKIVSAWQDYLTHYAQEE